MYRMGCLNGYGDSNILDIGTSVFFQVAQDIETPEYVFKKLVGCADNTRYELKPHEHHHISRCENPGERLLRQWGNQGMTVSELGAALKILRLEKPLLKLPFPHEPLTLILDLANTVELDQGNILRLTCEAVGFPFPKYCWFKHDDLIIENSTGILEITNVGLNDTGSYICRIHNSNKNVVLWTQWCKVHINEKRIEYDPPSMDIITTELPRIPMLKKNLPSNLKASVDKEIMLEFEVQGAPDLWFTWSKDGVILNDAPHRQPRYCIERAQIGDRGCYQCVVHNDFGHVKTAKCCVEVTINGTIEGQDIPTIVRQPQSKEGTVGQKVNFTVAVKCGQSTNYQWFHNRKEIENEKKPDLSVTILSDADAGEYQCLVKTPGPNDYSILTMNATLKVLHPEAPVYTATDKVALILGQSSYRTNFKQLPAVKNDMCEAYDVFTELGFKTLAFLDNTLNEMNQAVQLLINLMKSKGNTSLYVVVYFLGHGFLHNGQHYLMPHDAMEGPQISNCLCIEEVEKRIEYDLSPKLFFIGVDLCKKGLPSISEALLPPSDLKVSKNRVKFFAATQGEESYEEEVVEAKMATCSLSSQSPQPDKTNIQKVRGIFSRGLFFTMRKHKNTSVGNLYSDFNKIFQRPNVFTTEKEMNPEYNINMAETGRSLGDEISIHGQEDQYLTRLRNWETLNAPANTAMISIDEFHFIEIACTPRSSNILEVKVTESPKPHRHRIHFDIDEESVNTIVRPLERVSDRPSEKIYRLFNLQRLETSLKITLLITFLDKSPKLHRESVDLGRPLVCQVWKTQKSYCAPFVPQPRRQATEHHDDEACSSLQSV